ncbi:MAG TPA: aromatic-ring-hydroxylating dioxygenase subunit beta [Solirubrobacterales bacterium]|nr:aromatic-ring-hydroxylating dioxygenase subunit beta [Solirubrobacterales bacterium]
MNAVQAETERATTRIASGSQAYWRCVDFLVHEAEALDENRLDDWLAMLHPDIDYRAPIRVTRERTKGPGFSDQGYHFFENHESLNTRVERLETDYAWAEDPPSRTRRFITNFRVAAFEGGDLHVRSSLLVYRERLDETAPQFLVGEREDDLREVDGQLLLVRRRVLLDHSILMTPNLGVFL